MKDLEDYVKYLEYQRNYSKNTILNYERDILDFFDYLNSEGLNYLNILYKDLRYLLDFYVNTKKYDANSISRKISALRNFYRYLSNNGKILKNPFNLVTLPKKEKKLPKFLYYNELEEMIDSIKDDNPLGQRDKLIMEMLYGTGCRVGELVNIKVSDLYRDMKMVKLLGKGNKERMARYSAMAEVALKKYLSDGYDKLNTKKNDYLFLNFRGGKLTTRGVELIFNKIVKESSIKQNVHPHMIRHSFATHMLNAGCDILSVQELLGHASVSSTGIYTHVTNDHLKEVYFKTHPRARKR